MDCGYSLELPRRGGSNEYPQSMFLHIHLLNVVVQFIVFLTLSTLICRGTDISKCFSESLGIRDNESRLYTV